MVALKCPECAEDMTEHDVPTADMGAIYVDRCPGTDHRESCGSWYDRGEYAAIDPRLASQSARHALSSSARASSAKPLPCPRCTHYRYVPQPVDFERPRGGDAMLVSVRFVGVELGLCERCAGVWAPRGAVDAVIQALSLHEAGEGRGSSHYRSAATLVMRDNGALRTRCVECNSMVAFDESSLDVDGLVCVVCAAKRARGEGKADAIEPGFWGWIRFVLKDLGLR